MDNRTRYRRSRAPASTTFLPALVPAFLVAGALFSQVMTSLSAPIGVFEGETDIGKPGRSQPAVFDQATGTYTVSGGGENMWFTNDAFHYLWKKMAGDAVLETDLSFIAAGGNAHRKACLVVRQDLTPGSAYVDVALHGDGLTSLQFRETHDGLTHEIQANSKSPARVGLQRQGDTFALLLPGDDGQLKPAGPFVRIQLTSPVYVGLGVCAHDDKALETVKFSQVRLEAKEKTAGKPVLHCSLETVPIGSKDRRVIYHSVSNLIEAPNWSRDAKDLIFNSGGKLYRIPVTGGKPGLIDTAFANRCNNDHGLSPDGTTLAISDQSKGGKSLVYTVSSGGGTPKLITEQGPSYWHGWSPDGSTLAYCAERGGEFDIYTIPVNGGDEKRLTTAKGLDDGPDYSPDGKYIYFNSERSGSMQVWRMKSDGSQQEQVTLDEFNNWFPHPSPDGKWLVFLSYEKDVTGHPANKPVRLRLMPVSGGPVQELARLFGGQGTINVPSWSPDSRQVAFVSYELLE